MGGPHSSVPVFHESAFVAPSTRGQARVEPSTPGMLALILSAAPSLHTPRVNTRLSSRANARSSVRMITLVDEVDEKAMLVRRASQA